MTSEDFKAWRKDMGFTQQQAAEALGLSIQAVGNYDRGIRHGDEGGAVADTPHCRACLCRAGSRDYRLRAACPGLPLRPEGQSYPKGAAHLNKKPASACRAGATCDSASS
jgi:DNA-binding XRE family transcriptional regulator